MCSEMRTCILAHYEPQGKQTIDKNRKLSKDQVDVCTRVYCTIIVWNLSTIAAIRAAANRFSVGRDMSNFGGKIRRAMAAGVV